MDHARNFPQIGHANDHAMAVCITPGQRLARLLRLSFHAERLEEGLLSWETPDILPLPAWLQRTWEACVDDGADAPLPLLLGPFQEHALWERIIRASPESGAMAPLQITRAARHAMTAWGRLRSWRVVARVWGQAWRDSSHPDVAAFSRWAGRFVAHCGEHGWIDPGRALDSLIEALRAKRFPAVARMPKRIVLAGFHAFTPQQRDLWDALEGGGAEIVHWLPIWQEEQTGPARRVRVTLPDEARELEAAARWARALLERGEPGSIGIVVPEPAKMRSALLRVFDNILRPEAKWPGAPDSPRPLEFSWGEPLASAPPVRDALLSLTLADGALHPVSSFSQFLLSPYFAESRAESESMARAALDVSLRARGEPFLDLALFSDLLEEENEPPDRHSLRHPPEILRSKIRQGLSLLRALPPEQTLPDWARTFANWLACLGWPGEGVVEATMDSAMDSDEYSAASAFYELLTELARLNLVLGPVSFPVALAWLQHMAHSRVFQPESNGAPIRILGVEEGAALSFPRLWVLGMDAESWPPSPRPNPFLPPELQRRLGMPRASPHMAWAEAEGITGRMLAGSGEVVVSCAQNHGGFTRTASPLIAMLPQVEPATLARSHIPDVVREMGSGARHAMAEEFLDEFGPGLDSDKSMGEPLSGGTRIWQDQADCPFRAFARHRLGAAGIESPTVGLDYALRGIMTHRALEFVWRGLRGSDRLATMEEGALRRRVGEAVERALAEAAARRPVTLRGRLRAMERARLVALVMEWLAMEKKRPPFMVITPERRRVVSFGDLLPRPSGSPRDSAWMSLPVSIRPDRVDRVGRAPEGHYLLVDYKTGQARMADWFGTRPASVQLPLYAVVEQAEAIAFAFVRRDKIAFEGIAGPSGLASDSAPGIESIQKTRIEAARGFQDWTALRDAWRQTLVSLARSFAGGDARVDPRSPNETCRYCDLGSLCRISDREFSDTPL